MKRRDFICLLGTGVALGVCGPDAQRVEAQMGMGGYGMMGGCPLCGSGADVAIPERLPPPRDAAWRERFAKIYGLERLSLRQYETDSTKFGERMPYQMVIPQESNHIAWIEKLYAAYSITPPIKNFPLRPTSSPENAFQVAMGLEAELVPEYAQLIATAGDQITPAVLDVIMRQTRWHYTMFSHAARMGMGGGMIR